MIRLHDQLGRLGRALPAATRQDALQAILGHPHLQPLVQSLGRSDRRCPVVSDSFALLFLLAMGLFPDKSYRDLARQLLPAGAAIPARSTLCMARQRLGAEPLRLLAHAALRPLAEPARHPDAFYKGMRLVGLDGFCLAVPDPAANAALFGYHGNQHGRSGYPSVRVVALCELATHGVLDYELDGGTASETVLAAPLLRRLPPRCLLLWDRHYFAFDHLWQVLGRGGHVLARLSRSVKPRLLRRLPDGPYLAEAQ